MRLMVRSVLFCMWNRLNRARIQMFLSKDAVDREVLADIVRRHGLQDEWAKFEGEYME